MWIISADFSSALATQIHILYSFLLEIYHALSRKKRCDFLHGPPFTLCFQCLVCPKSCFLILICYYPNFMSKTDFFKNVFCLWCTLQLVFRKYKVFWIMLIHFNLTQNSLSKTHLQIQAAPRIEVASCFFYAESKVWAF